MIVFKHFKTAYFKIMKVLRSNGVRNLLYILIGAIGLVIARVTFAATGGDIDLSSVDNSIQGHLSGDFGRLMGLAALGWLIVASICGFSMKVLISVLIVLLAIALGPTLIDQVGSA